MSKLHCLRARACCCGEIQLGGADRLARSRCLSTSVCRTSLAHFPHTLETSALSLQKEQKRLSTYTGVYPCTHPDASTRTRVFTSETDVTYLLALSVSSSPPSLFSLVLLCVRTLLTGRCVVELSFSSLSPFCLQCLENFRLQMLEEVLIEDAENSRVSEISPVL